VNSARIMTDRGHRPLARVRLRRNARMSRKADQAIAALNGYTLEGRALNVNEARPKPESGLRRRRWVAAVPAVVAAAVPAAVVVGTVLAAGGASLAGRLGRKATCPNRSLTFAAPSGAANVERAVWSTGSQTPEVAVLQERPQAVAAAGVCRSLRSALASICRMRSRVTRSFCPTSSRVCSLPFVQTEAHLDDLLLARREGLQNLRGLLPQVQIDDRIRRRNAVGVHDEIAQVRFLFFARWAFRARWAPGPHAALSAPGDRQCSRLGRAPRW